MNAEKFTEIYDRGGWAGLGSGPGSAPRYNSRFLQFLSEFTTMNQVRSIVDLGCGDWQMMREFPLGTIEYLGVDVVESVIEENNRRFARDNVEFRFIRDISKEEIAGDLLLIKDVFIHLSNSATIEILEFAKRRFQFIMAVNDMRAGEASVNQDIETGGYRPVDLAAAPFDRKVITLLRYGSDTRYVRSTRSIRHLLIGEQVQSGRKHVQVEIGESG